MDQKQGHQEETHRPNRSFGRLFPDLLLMGWIKYASAMAEIKLLSSCYS